MTILSYSICWVHIWCRGSHCQRRRPWLTSSTLERVGTDPDIATSGWFNDRHARHLAGTASGALERSCKLKKQLQAYITFVFDRSYKMFDSNKRSATEITSPAMRSKCSSEYYEVNRSNVTSRGVFLPTSVCFGDLPCSLYVCMLCVPPESRKCMQIEQGSGETVKQVLAIMRLFLTWNTWLSSAWWCTNLGETSS